MAIRIKSRWRDDDHSMAESAEALAFITWRIALDKAITLHGQDYVYANDGQRVAVIAEYLAFQVQVADRLAYGRLSDEERGAFVTALACKLADHVQDNLTDLFGPGDYRGPFLDELNRRSDQYAEFRFEDDKPGYAFTRYLGERIQNIMGAKDLNRWVIDQVMEIDAPDAARLLKKAMLDLLA